MEIRKTYRNIPSTKRKAEHLEICLNKPVQFKDITTGLEHYRFIHNALPDTDLENINTGIELFGKKLAAPLIISPMVGGITRATVINRNLARAAQKLGLAMGVGSQRILVDHPETLNSFKVRDVAPDILLLANLGAVQLNYGVSAGQCLKIVE
jgi:isopentenyl-diphosphate delta-isomerase